MLLTYDTYTSTIRISHLRDILTTARIVLNSSPHIPAQISPQISPHISAHIRCVLAESAGGMLSRSQPAPAQLRVGPAPQTAQQQQQQQHLSAASLSQLHNNNNNGAVVSAAGYSQLHPGAQLLSAAELNGQSAPSAGRLNTNSRSSRV